MRTICIVCIVYLLSTPKSFAQNTKLIDSLKNVLKNHPTEDSVKVYILTLLHENIMFSKPLEAKKYAEEELRISKSINYKVGIGKGLLHLADFYSNRNSSDSALYYYNQAKATFIGINSYRGILFSNYSIADILRSRGDYNNAIKITQDNLKLIEENEKDSISKAKFMGAQYNNLAAVYKEKGDYKLALIEALKALNLFTKIEDNIRKADILKLLGDLEYQSENYENSLQYLNEAIAIYSAENDIIYLSYGKNAAGNTLKKLGRFKEAKNYQKQAIALSRKHKVNSALANALNDLGELFILEKKYQKAKGSFHEAKEISEKENIKLSSINALEGLSTVSKKLKQSESALTYINQAITIAQNIGAMPQLKGLYIKRARLLETLNKNKEALFDLYTSKKINDSLFSVKKAQQIEELRTIYETEKKEAAIVLQEKEIENLNKEVEISNLKKGLYAGGMASFIAISGLLFFSFRQRIKKNRIAREKQEEIYKQEIEFKKKELASQTLHLVQKNSFLQELKENLENLKNSPDKFKTEFRRIVMLLKKESASDKDWEVFKSYFTEVHDNFDHKIRQVYAEISEKEIRLASFLKMNLSTKEIADILNVLPDSVLKSKYRLKKKLNLDKETDLYDFLINL